MLISVRRVVVLNYVLSSLAGTSIFTDAAPDLVLQLTDTTPTGQLLPGETLLPVHRDVNPLLVAITSVSGVVRTVTPSEVEEASAEAGADFTTVQVRTQVPSLTSLAHDAFVRVGWLLLLVSVC